jgi:hypothetical protein
MKKEKVMKKILLFSMLGFALNMNAQTVVFEEDFGVVTANTNIADHTDFENGTPIVFTGNATIRISTPSEGYVGASGEGCVFIGAATPQQSITIEGINTVDFTDLALSLGHYKGTNAGSNELLIDVSEDGTAWTGLTYTRPTGAGTSNWILIEPTGTIPATANLRIRFSNPSDSNVGFRIDDVKLTGVDPTANTKNEMKDKFKVYPNPVSDGMVYITNQNNDDLNVKIYDITGKMLKNVKATDKVSIDGFATGIYLMKIESNGQSITKKIVVK